jgi:divalent metal cation (Fe/Co/Zn/Cd) transporter
VIAWNGLRLLSTALNEVMDSSVPAETVAAVRALAAEVDGVVAIEKCRIRKSGLHLVLDIHVIVNGDLSVRRGHEIAHLVKDRLLNSPHRINDVTVHIEPARDEPARSPASTALEERVRQKRE